MSRLAEPQHAGATVPDGTASAAASPQPLLGRTGRLLAALFPRPEEPPLPRRPVPVVALGYVAAALAGAALLLARYVGEPPWNTLWAEDGWIFLRGAMQHSWASVVAPYAGYAQLVPRLIAQGVSWLPLRDAAPGFAIAGALVAAGCAVFAYHASAGHVRAPALRVLLGLAVLLLPTALLEISANGVNTPWYLLFASFWALLWRPRSWPGAAVAAAVCFAAAASTTLAAVFAPLVLARVIALPRAREQAATAAWLAGCVLQVPAVLGSSSQLSRVATLGQAAAFYGHDVIMPAAGWHLSWQLRAHAGSPWDVLIPAAVLAVAALWAWLGGDRRVRLFVTTAIGLGFALTLAGAVVRWWVTINPVSPTFEPGSRYTAVPILLLDAVAVVAVDGWLRRRGTAPRHVMATFALIAVLGAGWVADFRYPSARSNAPAWSQTVDHARLVCERHGFAVVPVAPLETSVSCSLVRG